MVAQIGQRAVVLVGVHRVVGGGEGVTRLRGLLQGETAKVDAVAADLELDGCGGAAKAHSRGSTARGSSRGSQGSGRGESQKGEEGRGKELRHRRRRCLLHDDDVVVVVYVAVVKIRKTDRGVWWFG